MVIARESAPSTTTFAVRGASQLLGAASAEGCNPEAPNLAFKRSAKTLSNAPAASELYAATRLPAPNATRQ
eukprot:1060805-Pyramimonas_sp.AAC.1